MVNALASWLRVHPLRLLRAPALSVTARSERRSEVTVDGLVCGLCARRTAAALAAVPGVRSVRVDLERGAAELRYASGAAPDVAALRLALEGVVVAPRARLLLSALARRARGAR